MGKIRSAWQQLAVMAALAMAMVVSAPALVVNTNMGTDAMDAMKYNIDEGADVFYPVLIGLLGLFLGVALYKKFTHKAGVGT